jgi:soluble lytic murein transglycosylase-like protein
VLAVVEVESNFDPRARSHKNAQGLMQLIPATAERFGVDDVWDPEQNLRGGMSYLRWLLDHFDGDIKLALAGYNAGEQAVRRHRGIPPYAETRAYVERISRRLNL